MKKIAVFLLSLFLFGCSVAMPPPAKVLVSTSKFDNATEISTEPAWLYDSKVGIKFSLFRRSTMPEDKIILNVIVSGAHIFSRKKSLQFNIEDKFVSFNSIDTYADIDTTPGSYFSNIDIYFPPQNWSKKRYEIDRAFLKRIIEAEKVIVRVNLEKTYAEGVFSSDYPTTARPVFRKFYNMLSE